MQHMIESGALELLKRSLDHSSMRIREVASWAVGNVSGDSPEYRDLCLASGMMPLILELCLSSEIEASSTAVWVVSNFCRGVPNPPRQDVIPCISVLAHTMMSKDQGVRKDSLWTLGFLATDSNQLEILASGMIPKLVQILNNPRSQDTDSLLSALDVIGNVACGPQEFVKALLDAGIATTLGRSLSHRHHGVLNSAFRAVSGLCATGTASTIKEVSSLLPFATRWVLDPEFSNHGILKHASFCIINTVSGADPEFLSQLLEEQPPIFQSLLALCHSTSPYFHPAMNSIDRILSQTPTMINLSVLKPHLPSLAATCTTLLSQGVLDESSVAVLTKILGFAT